MRGNRHHWHTRRADVLSVLLPVVAISPHKHQHVEAVLFEGASFWTQNVSGLAKQPLNPSGGRHRGVEFNEQIHENSVTLKIIVFQLIRPSSFRPGLHYSVGIHVDEVSAPSVGGFICYECYVVVKFILDNAQPKFPRYFSKPKLFFA